MGAAMSSPIDEEKMKGIVEGTLATFGEKYGKSYSSAIVSKIADDARKDGGDSDYKLLQRPAAEVNKDPIKTGYATKEGAVVKSWKKRFFVVRWDYKIEYYDKEETFKAGGQPKGTINPAGYKVSEDPTGELTKRLEALALKLKMDVPSLGKPKSLPPNTVGLLRDRRRDWYIQFDSPAQVAEWLPILNLACTKAKGLNNPDPVAQAAFNSAFAATRIARGYRNAKDFSGSEDQNLSDLLTKQLESQVLPDVFGKIESEIPAGKMRSMASDKVSSTIETFVGGAVSSAWSATSRAVEATRSTVEGAVQPKADLIVSAQDKVRAKITDTVSPAVDRVVARIGAPLADVVLPVVMAPVHEAHKFLFKLHQEHLEKTASAITSGGDDSSIFKELAKLAPKPATFAEIVEKLKVYHTLLDKADKFGEIKPGVEDIENMISTTLTKLKDLLDRVFYTLQALFQKAVKDGKDKATAIKEASAETTSRLNNDINVSMLHSGRELLATFVMPKVKEEVSEPAAAQLEPIQSEVPDFLQSLVNLEDDLDATIEDIVNNALDTLVRPAVPAFQA